MPGQAGETVRDVLGGWPGWPAPCYFHSIARAYESGQGCGVGAGALGEEL